MWQWWKLEILFWKMVKYHIWQINVYLSLDVETTGVPHQTVDGANNGGPRHEIKVAAVASDGVYLALLLCLGAPDSHICGQCCSHPDRSRVSCEHNSDVEHRWLVVTIIGSGMFWAIAAANHGGAATIIIGEVASGHGDHILAVVGESETGDLPSQPINGLHQQVNKMPLHIKWKLEICFQKMLKSHICQNNVY